MPRPTQRFALAAACAVIALSLVAGLALAQSSDKLRSGQTVTIPTGETVGSDLYVFAGTIRVEGTVDGDLIALGGTIDIPGTVTGDVLGAGGNVSVTGTVGGDARVTAGAVTVSGSVAEDLATAGGQVMVSPSGTVGEDMLASAGRLIVDGTVTGDLTASTGTYDKAGTVGGTEDVIITPRPTAPGTPMPTPADQTATVTRLAVDGLQHFLIVLIVGGLLIWLAPRAYTATKEAIQRRPLPAAGWGVVGLFGYMVAVLVIILAMIVLAIIFGVVGFDDLVGLDVLAGIVAILGATLGFVVVCAYVADAIVGAAVAGLAMRRQPSTTRTREFMVMAVGAAVVVLLSVIPVIGPWVKFVVIVLGLGAVLLAWWTSRRPTPAQPVFVPPAAPAPPTSPTSS
jgi:cytoskeletal protein CcmA (bactofilin family)